MRGSQIFLAIAIQIASQPFGATLLGSATLQESEFSHVGSDAPGSLAEPTPIITVQVGDATLNVPQNYIDGSDGFQDKFGYLRIRALLPCLIPEPLDNRPEFEGRGWGKVVVARFSVLDPHELTGERLLAAHMKYNRSVKYLREHPTSDEEDFVTIPNSDFRIYKDDLLRSDLFFRDESGRMFVLECWRHVDAPYPSCSSRSVVEEKYLLEYEFSRSFIDESVDESLVIDRKIHDLFLAFLSRERRNAVNITGVCK